MNTILKKINQIMSISDIPGLGIAIVSPTATKTATFGVSNLSTGKQIIDSDIWQLASVSKNISATAVAWLTQINPSVEFDTLVGNHFNSEAQNKSVTVADCLSHTTGLPTMAGSTMATYGYSWTDILKTMKSYPDSGFRYEFHYGNESLTLGVNAAAQPAKISSSTLLTEFFKASGMRNATVDYNTIQASSQMVTSHVRINGKLSPSRAFDQRAFIPAAGVAASLNDMEVYLKIHTEKLLPDLDKLYVPIVKSGVPNGEYYGLGTAISKVTGETVYLHNGLYATGWSSVIMYSPEHKIGIAIMTNSVNPVPQALAAVSYTHLTLPTILLV